MNKVEEMLKELYDNDDISIGVHGTAILPDPSNKFLEEICEKGLMCRYGDIRRTVSLQDRGMIHAHGNIDFERLIKYNYSKNAKGYNYKVIQDGKNIHHNVEEIDLEQCSFIIAIPKEMKTTDEGLFSGEKREFKRQYARSADELRIGRKEEIGRPINPKYIVGYYTNGDIENFQYNSRFYGFKNNFKEGEIPELDLEEIKRVNTEVRKTNEKKYTKKVEELGKETLSQQKDTKNKNRSLNFLNKLKDRLKPINKGRDE